MQNMHFRLEVTDPTARDLFEACEKSLSRFGQTELVEQPTKRQHGPSAPDGFLVVTTAPGISTHYVAQAKRQVHPETLTAIISRLQDLASNLGLKPLLITEYVSPKVSDILKSSNVAYLDCAGNALLLDPPLFVWLRGFRTAQKFGRVARAFQTTGLRFIAFLLKTPDAVNWPYRRLADEAQFSLGSASRILGDLRSLGFIGLAGPNRNVLINRQSLLEQWESGYSLRLRAKLKPRLYRQAEGLSIDQLPQFLPQSMHDDILLGGELAAAIITGHLRPQTATLHVRPHRPLLPVLKELRLIPDANGNITIMDQLDATGAWRWKGVEATNLVHPLLIHAELLSGLPDDRLRETARMIYDQYLAPTLNDDTAP